MQVSSFSLLAAAVFLSACDTMPQRTADDATATSSAGYGRAFGRVNYVEGGKEAEWSTSPFTTSAMTLFVRAAGTGQMHYMYMEGDGSFNWPLLPGEYVILGYQVARKMGVVTRNTARLGATFTVPQAGQAVYIGELSIRADATGSAVAVLDRYAESLKKIEPQLVAGKFEPVNRAMRLETPPGSYIRVVGICTTVKWQLQCDKEFQGVRPVRPEGAAQGFPVAESLAPALEWSPAGKTGITYDVAIYESLSFMFGMDGRVDRLRGTLVAYAERLQEPKYAPASPLAPGKRYEWTVRLRDGGDVSTWSTTSYGLYAVVAWSRGSGRGFGLETPAR